MELSRERKKALKIFRVRINRGIGIAAKKKNYDKLNALSKLEEFTDQELDTVLHASAPVVPLLPENERLSLYTYFLNFKRKEAIKRTLRAIIIEAMNSIRLTSSAKKMFITYLTNGVAKGNKKPDNIDDKNDTKAQSRKYIFVLMSARDMVTYDEKNKKDELDVNFKEIQRCFDEAVQERKNFIDLIDFSKKLNEKDKQYMYNILNDADREFRTIEDILNLQVAENPPFNSSPLFVNGRSSVYKKNEKITTYAQQLAHVGYDLLKFIGADLELVCQIHKEESKNDTEHQ